MAHHHYVRWFLFERLKPTRTRIVRSRFFLVSKRGKINSDRNLMGHFSILSSCTGIYWARIYAWIFMLSDGDVSKVVGVFRPVKFAALQVQGFDRKHDDQALTAVRDTKS